MRDFVGVSSWFTILGQSSLKRDALIFDRIALLDWPLLSSILKQDTTLGPEIEYLINKEIVFESSNDEAHLSRLKSNDEIRSLWDLFSKSADEAFKISRTLDLIPIKGTEGFRIVDKQRERAVQTEKLSPEEYARILASLLEILASNVIKGFEYRQRIVCVQLRELYNLETYPILPNYIHGALSTTTKSETVQITLKSLPIPDESVPWEQIIEYRSDPDSQSKFLALRHWMSEVARAELTPAEVEEKLEYLIDQYRQHMRLHRMKTNVGTLETVVTTGAEFLGDLVSFKWGKAAEALFSLRRRRVALLEGELTAPGSEVAYIVKARETFS